MTAQFHDTVVVNGISWQLVGVDGGPLFEPGEYRIKPGPVSTACYRGHISSYEIGADHRLRLVALLLSGAAMVNERPLSEDEEVLGAIAHPTSHRNEYVLEPLTLDVEFSGRLLLGREWISSKGANMGFQPGWTFSEVIDMAFERGRQISRTDVSTEMGRIREAISAGTMPEPDGARGSPEWVSSRFTLGYSRSFGSSQS